MLPGAFSAQGAQQGQRGSAGEGIPCPRCREGRLTLRQGKNGAFWGCDRYPACRFTADDDDGSPLLGPSPARRDLAWQPGGKAASAEASHVAKTAKAAKSAKAGKGLREGSLFDLAGAPAEPSPRSFSQLPSAGLFDPGYQTRKHAGSAGTSSTPAFRESSPKLGGSDAVPWADGPAPNRAPSQEAGFPPDLAPDLPDMPEAWDAAGADLAGVPHASDLPPWADFTPDESAMPDFGDVPPLDEAFPDGMSPDDIVPDDMVSGGMVPGDMMPGDVYPGGHSSAPAGQGLHQGQRQGQHGGASDIPCPSCRTNHLVLRQGRNGPFWGCSGFPRCRFTCQDRNGQPQLPQGGSAQGSGRRS